MLSNPKVHTRLKLSLLWTTIMCLYIYADYFNLMTPDALNHMIDLKTPVGPTTPEVLMAFSVLLIIPALMIPASLMLKPVLSRWLNIILAVLYGLISVLIIASSYDEPWLRFFVLYQCVELLIFASIIYAAWNWPRESQPNT